MLFKDVHLFLNSKGIFKYTKKGLILVEKLIIIKIMT